MHRAFERGGLDNSTLRAEVEALRSEYRRLYALVEDAFREGRAYGEVAATAVAEHRHHHNEDEDWERSDSRKERGDE